VNLRAAIVQILQESSEPLHSRDICARILNSGLWQTTDKTPADTVSARLSTDKATFTRVSPGVYSLTASTSTLSVPIEIAVVGDKITPLTFLDAAEKILGQESGTSGLHYREITKRALAQRLLATNGLTPKASMSAQLGTEIARSQASGERQRFMKVSRGIFALAQERESSLRDAVESHNEDVRQHLLSRLKSMNPYEFEAVITVLLERMGFQDVEKTSRSNDGGIDVFGYLVVADVIRTRMAVQVKRWANNVQGPTIQQVRGSLGVHDQGLITTTSDFSSGSIVEAQKPDRQRVSLMSGEQLVHQLIEFGIGVDKSQIAYLELFTDPISPPVE